MSDRAQRVLDALLEYDADRNYRFPIQAIGDFYNSDRPSGIDEDYEALTIDEEKQVVEAFLEHSY